MKRQKTFKTRTMAVGRVTRPHRLQYRPLMGALALSGLLGVTPQVVAAQGSCPDLSAFKHEGVELAAPVYQAEGDFCVVKGQMESYQGQDGKPYAIRFELRLPKDWNERYVHQFNGGVDGIVTPATGPINVAQSKDTALSRGFAVISSDAGHAINANPDKGAMGATQFGMDARARANYGYGAVAKLDPVARAIVEAAYGKPIRYSYGIGRSNGGRHAMVAASRMPEAFDGLLVGYPGFNLPKAAIQHAWDAQILYGLTGDIRTSFSQDELNTISKAVLQQCDALDGQEDGLVFDWQQCQAVFDPKQMQCANDAQPDCLPVTKVQAMQKMLAGPTDSQGKSLYSSWYWDSGFNTPNWQMWKIRGGDEKSEFLPRIVAMGAASLAQVFSTPPVEPGTTYKDIERFLLDYDFDQDAPAITATSAEFPESAMEFMVPLGLYEDGFEAFRQAGGKMLVYHGLSDPVFSAADTVNWYDNLPNAGDFSRLYLVPGMPHGHSPAAPDDIDWLTPLQAWVEEGQAPQALEARRLGSAQWPEVKRPLCPYPAITKYQEGDASASSSFACVSR